MLRADVEDGAKLSHDGGVAAHGREGGHVEHLVQVGVPAADAHLPALVTPKA
jgi:hypothetical protein